MTSIYRKAAAISRPTGGQVPSSRYQDLWTGPGLHSQPEHLGAEMLGARPPRPLPADFAVAQFIEDLALDTDVHATPLLTLRGHAQIYRFSLGRRRVRVCIAHVPLDHVRALDERDRFVSIAIRNVLIDGIDAPWPLALDAVAHRLTGERRIYTGPGVWERL